MRDGENLGFFFKKLLPILCISQSFLLFGRFFKNEVLSVGLPHAKNIKICDVSYNCSCGEAITWLQKCVLYIERPRVSLVSSPRTSKRAVKETLPETWKR